MYSKEKYILKNWIDNNVWCALYKFKDDVFIAGGAITSVFSGSKINDLDIYFKSQDGVDKLTDFFKNLKGAKLVFSTKKAKTYVYRKQCYQLIIHPDLITKNCDYLFSLYDYTVCMGAYDIAEDKFYFHNHFHHHLAQKKLVFNINTKYPICSLMRVRKYLQRGYKISYSELVKIALTINSLDLFNLGVLKDQLEGIDTLFLKPLMDKLEEKAEQEYDFEEFIDELNETLDNIYEGKIKLNDWEDEDENN